MIKSIKHLIKYIIGFIICLLIRFIPFRPPNIEPVLGVQMPFSASMGSLYGFLFAFLNIIIFDLLTGKFGSWSFLTAGAYGVLGVWAAFFFKTREAKRLNFVYFSIIGTLFFDIVTGLSIGPMFFGQPFGEALIGQIPFTAMHLLGNVSFAAILSPLIYKNITQNENLETINVFKFIKLNKNIS